MHICMDEISVAMAVVTSGSALFPRIRALIRRAVARVFRPRRGVDCTCTQCVSCPCDDCKEMKADPLYSEKVGLQQWLTHVAPLLGNNPPPEDAKYTWAQRISSDGSEYIVHGVIYPIGPRR